jgi:hypothetical protein
MPAKPRLKITAFVESRKGKEGYTTKAKVRELFKKMGVNVHSIEAWDHGTNTGKGFIFPYEVYLRHPVIKKDADFNKVRPHVRRE